MRLTSEEQAWVARRDQAAEEIKAAQKRWHVFVGDHTCRMQEEQSVGHGREPIYPTHPICGVCGEVQDMQLYCHESPTHMCEFTVGDKTLTSEEILSAENHHGPIEPTTCIHCGDFWPRSE